MTAYTYLKSAFTSLAGANVDARVLKLEIENSAIGVSPPLRPGVEGASWINDDADPTYQFDFNGTLSAPNETVLDGIVTAHAGPLARRGSPGFFSKTVAPTINDDDTIGVQVGTTWVDTVTKRKYTCHDAATGSAEWHRSVAGNIKTPAANEVLLIGTGDGGFDEIPFASLFLGTTVGLELTRTDANTVTVGVGLTVDDTLVKILLIDGTPPTCVLNANGAGGLDTGSEAADTIYYLYLIQDAAGTQAIDLLFSLSSTTPTMPGSYDVKQLIGHVLNDGSSDIVNFVQHGKGNDRIIEYYGTITNAPFEVLATGGSTAFVDVDLSDVVPATSELATCNFMLNGSMGGEAEVRPKGAPAATIEIHDKCTVSTMIGCPGQDIQYKVASGGDLTIQVRKIHYSI